MSLLIQNGEWVTADKRGVGDILCEGERITRIEPRIEPPPGAEVVDATGRIVFPGFVDPHVHAYLPMKDMGTKDDYTSTGTSALLGGTTCFIDFCGSVREETPLQAWDRWRRASEGKSPCDFSWHMTVAKFDAAIREELEEVIRRGVTSFKVYLAYKDVLDLSDAELLAVMAFAAERGVRVAAHCENAGAIDLLQRRLLAQGKTGPEWHYASRPPSVEEEGVQRFMACAEWTGAEAYIVHLSCDEALQAALRYRARGVKGRIETMIHYLLLDRTYAERGNFEGAKYVLSPPLRDTRNQDLLWAALRDGRIDTVGTDHCPFDFNGQKTRGRDNFTLIPNGIGSVEHRIPLLYTYGVEPGRIDLQTLVAVASTNPAKVFGLYPRKGALAPGSDADMVVWDPAYRGVISASTHAMRTDYDPYEGFAIHGRPVLVTVRGKVVVRNGEFTGTVGRGSFLPRSCSDW